MERNILVLVNGVPKLNFVVEKTTTIRDIKSILNKTFPEYTKNKVSFLINSKTQMNIFDTTNFDHKDLSSVWDSMENSRIEMFETSHNFEQKKKEKKERTLINPSKGIFNKYFTPAQLETEIPIRFTIKYEVTGPEDEPLSDNQVNNWDNFSYRNETYLARFIYNALKPYIPSLQLGDSFSWRSKYVSDPLRKDYVELTVTSISIPEPEVVQCKKLKCPYKNYFEVCRNCEDDIEPNRKMIEEYQKRYDEFVRQVEVVEKMPYVSLKFPQKVEGYIPHVGEIEATVQ